MSQVSFLLFNIIVYTALPPLCTAVSSILINFHTKCGRKDRRNMRYDLFTMRYCSLLLSNKDEFQYKSIILHFAGSLISISQIYFVVIAFRRLELFYLYLCFETNVWHLLYNVRTWTVCIYCLEFQNNLI